MKQPTKKVFIDPSGDDFGAIVNCAVRYAIGRRTYMPGIVQRFVTLHAPFLSNRTLDVMQEDILNAHSYGDETIDKPGWMALLDAITAELARRKGG